MTEKTLLSDDGELFDACAELVGLAAGAGVTLGTAESCTGGLVAGCLTAVPGSSAVVRGGVVSYSADVKQALLGVSDAVVRTPGVGVVSGECAEQMARGARLALGCDVAVSVTGIAGPVWLGLATPGGTRSLLCRFGGDRAEVRRQAVRRALALLREGVVETGRGA